MGIKNTFSKKLSRLFSAMLTTVAGMTLLIAQPALACGGFFCSNLPVDQVGERIVFGVEPGHVTAIIQIAFEGSANDFAWVIPVQSAPEIQLGPEDIFNQVDWRSAPQWSLNWDWGNDECGWMLYPPVAEMDDADFASGGNEVIIMDQQEVGPFLTVTLDATDASALLDWLNDNGFDQPEESLPIIEHYLELEMLFVAVKLEEGATTGDLQPLMLDFEGNAPCIPLVLTRIAAQPDMPVYAWVFGDDRAVPANWFNVEVNEKKINWLDGGSNYTDVATAAIDEAAGHGFITEFAGEMDTVNWLWWEGRFDLDKLAGKTDPADFIDEMFAQNFPRSAQTQSLIRKYIPMPPLEDMDDESCADENQFYNWNKEQCFSYMADDWVFDYLGFVAELEERVVTPMQMGQLMLDKHDYMTRLFSTVSPDEMTRDPMFAFNPELDEVSNFHQADAVTECSEDGTEVLSVTITVANGESFTVDGPIEIWGGPMEDYADPVPDESASGEIQVLSTTGPPEVIALEDVEQREQTFQMMDPSYLPIEDSSGEDTPDDGTGDDTTDDGTGDDTSDDGTGDDTTDDGTGDDTPDDGTGDDTTDDGTTDDGTGDETPDDGTGDDTTDDGAGDDTTDDGAGDDTTDDGAGDETPDDGAGDDTTDDGTDDNSADNNSSGGGGGGCGATPTPSGLLFILLALMTLGFTTRRRQES